MNKERLLKLADYVDANVEEDKFSMSTFFSKDVSDIDDLLHGCRTTACLAGWACTIPEFQELGFRAEVRQNPWGVWLIPMHNSKDTFSALEEFFDLSGREALYLFGEYSDEDERVERRHEDVATATNRIRDFVATGVMRWKYVDEEEEEEEEE